MPSELTLTLFMGKVAVDPVPREVIEALTEAKVSIKASGTSGFDLTFAVGKKSTLLTQLLPNGYFDPPTRVVIAVTKASQINVLMDGVITQHEMVPSSESGRSVLSLKGEDLTRMMDLIDLSGFPFPALPAEARVALMVAKYTPIYKIVPMVIPSIFMDFPSPLDVIPPQRGTDLTYIKLLADRVGYVFYLQAGPVPGMSLAYWGPMLRAPIPFLPQPAPFAINWDGRSNVESLQFSFDGFAKTQFVVLIQEGNSNIPIPIPVPDINPISPPLGAKSPMPLKFSPITGLAKYSALQAAAIALAKAAASANVVSGQGSLDVTRYGEILNPRTVVEVRGAGITYDGQYFVDSVSHTIKPGSYKQSFTLSRNALIAGSAVPGADLISYLLSPVQQLAGFASPAATSADQPFPASILP